MAEAAPKSIGDEIWFNDAVMLRIDTWGSAEEAERALVRELKDGVPWSHVLPDGTRVPGDAAFWSELFVQVDRAQNRAYIAALIEPMPPFTTPDPSAAPTAVFAIKVARAAGVTLIPTATVVEVVGRTSGKTLIEAAARQMKRDGEIPDRISNTQFAEVLASRAGVTMRYVRNHLNEWGLWPPSDIE